MPGALETAQRSCPACTLICSAPSIWAEEVENTALDDCQYRSEAALLGTWDQILGNYWKAPAVLHELRSVFLTSPEDMDSAEGF